MQPAKIRTPYGRNTLPGARSDPEFDVVNAFQLEWIFHPSTRTGILSSLIPVTSLAGRNYLLDARRPEFGCGHAVQPVIPLGSGSRFADRTRRVSAP